MISVNRPRRSQQRRCPTGYCRFHHRVVGIERVIFNVVGNLQVFLLDLINTNPAFIARYTIHWHLSRSASHLSNCIFAILLNDFLHLAQLNGLVALGIFLDVEGDLEVTGVRVIGTAAVGVILFGGLFGLFLRGSPQSRNLPRPFPPCRRCQYRRCRESPRRNRPYLRCRPCPRP